MSSPKNALAVQVLERLLAHDSLKENLQFIHIQRLLDFFNRLWPEIVPPQQSRPSSLPLPITNFLASALDLEPSLIHLVWCAFGDLAEASYAAGPPPSLDDLFRIHAHPYKLGAENLSPPVSYCVHPGCNSNPLGEPSVVEGRLYTLRRGVLPIFSKSTYCRSCRTRYYNNYFIHEASGPESRRQYYSEEVPTFIHVHETSYVDVDLCKYFSMEMALAHGTCSGIAKVYNQALGVSQLPNSSRLSHDLTGDLVLDSFIHYSILQDKKIRRETLSLPHGGHQNHRYDEAMAERNYRMAGTGQPMWAHSCNRCMKLYKGGDGQWYRLTAGVHDGVTVRHLCCSVHNCLEALQSQLHHFCFTHRDLAKICCMHTVLSKWLPKKGIPQCFSCAGVCEKQLQLRLQKLL
ncbi:hypothetical protein C8R45DRAFT_379283 [Mycena sanguinolenta]|nr:hypothetical protein C8R45DRAFT_379283 [Mycena sanguinolenta]